MSTSNSLSVLQVADIVCKKYNIDPQINWVKAKSWKTDNKTIGLKYKQFGLHYNTSREAIENLDKEIY